MAASRQPLCAGRAGHAVPQPYKGLATAAGEAEGRLAAVGKLRAKQARGFPSRRRTLCRASQQVARAPRLEISTSHQPYPVPTGRARTCSWAGRGQKGRAPSPSQKGKHLQTSQRHTREKITSPAAPADGCTRRPGCHR